MQENKFSELEDFLFELQQSFAFEDVFNTDSTVIQDTQSEAERLAQADPSGKRDPRDLLTSPEGEHNAIPTGKRDPPEGVLIPMHHEPSFACASQRDGELVPLVYISDFLSGNSRVEEEYILDPSIEAHREVLRAQGDLDEYSGGREYTELDLVYWDTEWSKLPA